MFASVQDVRDQSTIEPIKADTVIPDNTIELYIERANSYLRSVTKRDYSNATDELLLADLRRATVLLVEYIWFINQEEVKDEKLSGVKSERILSYSYTKDESRSGETGNPELDRLLESLSWKPSFSHFSTSGPTKRNKRGDYL